MRNDARNTPKVIAASTSSAIASRSLLRFTVQSNVPVQRRRADVCGLGTLSITVRCNRLLDDCQYISIAASHFDEATSRERGVAR